jgi:hypothetical protein
MGFSGTNRICLALESTNQPKQPQGTHTKKGTQNETQHYTTNQHLKSSSSRKGCSLKRTPKVEKIPILPDTQISTLKHKKYEKTRQHDSSIRR